MNLVLLKFCVLDGFEVGLDCFWTGILGFGSFLLSACLLGLRRALWALFMEFILGYSFEIGLLTCEMRMLFMSGPSLVLAQK